MANICCVNYRFSSTDKDAVEKLHKVINDALGDELYLGYLNFARKIGMGIDGVGIRGDIDSTEDVYQIGASYTLDVYCEDDWSPCPEFWLTVIDHLGLSDSVHMSCITEHNYQSA